MSYDTSICIDTGAEFPVCVEDVGNITSNIGCMYYKAMPGPYKGGGKYDGHGDPDPERGGLTGISGLPCPAAAKIIESGLAYMEQHEDEMRAMEPDNGRGSYEGALKYLRETHGACLRHQKATLAVNW